ncbi:para-aminobenzoate synthetase component 1 [Vibrio hangzhouensis]|uniref:aminodeoxychorismate synthase n=2 Tax=Vibrio hangzhouensis TaxID=462991 RepID=A0A1H6C565_9VIBR|nr:para-aminobenzoate synthetase component 1 [Vibrio hangzhouensis]
MSATTFLSQFKQMNKKQSQSIQFIDIPYYPELATERFATIEQLPWSMLLKSSTTPHENNRFDILVTKPIATVESFENESVVTVNGERSTSDEDPFVLINHLIDTLIGYTDEHSEWPFIGGAAGYFAYDLGRRVERIPTIAADDIEAADMAVGIYDWALIVDHQQHKATIVGNNCEEHHQWLTSQTPPDEAPFRLTSDWQSNMTEKAYQQKFDSVQNYLHAGDCYQINLAQRHTADYLGSEWQAFCRLDTQNQAPFSAFIRTEQSAILSVSPERFLQLEHGKIETKPIKGTRPRSNDAEQDQRYAEQLQNATKDQAENLMIVDLLRNDIGRVATPGSVQVPRLFSIESFPAVHHLVSTVTGVLAPKYSATDLLKACFPGGSITGAPKVRAMEIIEELEPHRRSVYCGSIGYISAHGVMDTSITIRTLIAKEGKIHAWAGGGIVADSECSSEYQETYDKLGKILPVLANL